MLQTRLLGRLSLSCLHSATCRVACGTLHSAQEKPLLAGYSQATSRQLHGRDFQRKQPHRSRTSLVVKAAKKTKSPEEVVKRITRDDVTITFARSGGAGGQNVNKVNTKVDMRLNVDDSSWLDEDMKDALQRLEKKRINKEGELVVSSSAERTQLQNIEDALEKIQSALDRAADSLIPIEEDPEKKKQIAKQLKLGNENRLDDKKKKSDKKSMRRAKIDFS